MGMYGWFERAIYGNWLWKPWHQEPFRHLPEGYSGDRLAAAAIKQAFPGPVAIYPQQ
jgi:hypothetical protein